MSRLQVKEGDCVEVMMAMGNFVASVIKVTERLSDDVERTHVWVTIAVGKTAGEVPINSIVRVLDPVEAIARADEL